MKYAFELIVGAQLVRTNHELYYWREGTDEVDFILKEGRNLFAIEVKSGRKKSKKGLAKFSKKFPHVKTVLITFENYFDFEKNPLYFLKENHI